LVSKTLPFANPFSATHNTNYLLSIHVCFASSFPDLLASCLAVLATRIQPRLCLEREKRERGEETEREKEKERDLGRERERQTEREGDTDRERQRERMANIGENRIRRREREREKEKEKGRERETLVLHQELLTMGLCAQINLGRGLEL